MTEVQKLNQHFTAKSVCTLGVSKLSSTRSPAVSFINQTWLSYAQNTTDDCIFISKQEKM